MAKYLSQEWLDLGRELAQEFPERPGASARMQYVVTGGPEDDKEAAGIQSFDLRGAAGHGTILPKRV